MKVLVADDDPVALCATSGRLRTWGYEVTAVEDGDAALLALRAPGGPQIALLDWMMPGLDGPEVCRLLRADPTKAGAFLILVTARSSADAAEALDAGANDFLTKPFDDRELRARLGVASRVVGLEDQLHRRVDELQTALCEVEQVANDRARAQTQWRALFESHPLPVWVYDRETLAFIAVNDAAVRRYGYSHDEFQRLTIKDIRPPEDVPRLLEDVRRAAELDSALWRHRTREGRVFEVEVHSHTMEFAGRPAELVVAQDVSERVLLEAQLLQAQKMEGIGQLAGGIAHDFNNLLAAITIFTELASEDLIVGDPRAENLAGVLDAVKRATTLTRQLLAFSRQQVLRPQILDLNAVIRDIGKLLTRVIGEDVTFETVLDPRLRAVRADAGQLEQVLVNLAVNARDAMPTGGRFRVETRHADLNAAAAGALGLAGPGGHAVIVVSDTGTGMRPEVLARAFEPFFTTKGPKGSGLGLATVYGIVKQSGGHLGVTSELGRGTTFSLHLPEIEQTTVESARPAEPESKSERGSETVLVAEDDPAVRTGVETVLKRLGYTVLATQSGEEALAKAHAFKGRIDLVLTDVVMPGIDGPQLVRRLRETMPDLRAILTSGYAGDAIARRGVVESGLPFIEKPYSMAALALRLRSVLDDEPVRELAACLGPRGIGSN